MIFLRTRALCRAVLALSIGGAGILGAQASIAETDLSISDYVVERDEPVYGRPLASYANAWWQWAFSMPQAISPVHDRDGTYCDVNQSGSVWFLAGGFGTQKIHRNCTLPGQRFLFFPVINMVSFPQHGYNWTCDHAKRAAAANNNDFTFIKVFLNGSPLDDAQRFRIAPDTCFDIYERVPEEYTHPLGAPSATDGYWIMLKPLPPGTYDLEFRAFYTNSGGQYGDMVQNISYRLTIPIDEQG